MTLGMDFVEEVVEAGFDFFTGVPCSYLTPLMNGVLARPELSYVGATSEGEAVAIAAGAWLAGKRTVVMCQNSGLGNAVNPLTSLSHPFRIPTLFVTTWRGQPGSNDEPQHEVMGRITQDLIALIGFEQAMLPTMRADIANALDHASVRMDESGLPYVFVVKMAGSSEPVINLERQATGGLGRRVQFPLKRHPPTRAATLERLLAIVPESAALIATTGKCGRELFTLSDRRQHLYQVGSMGCAPGIALGVALNVENAVVVLDGDGALLMKMGSLATIGAQAPSNLIHVLLDNGAHDSTGGQPTVSGTVDFVGAALACGYRYGASCDSLDDFEIAFRQASAKPGPSFIRVRIVPGSLAFLGRPTVTPADVARRFRDFLASPS